MATADPVAVEHALRMIASGEWRATDDPVVLCSDLSGWILPANRPLSELEYCIRLLYGEEDGTLVSIVSTNHNVDILRSASEVIGSVATFNNLTFSWRDDGVTTIDILVIIYSPTGGGIYCYNAVCLSTQINVPINVNSTRRSLRHNIAITIPILHQICLATQAQQQQQHLSLMGQQEAAGQQQIFAATNSMDNGVGSHPETDGLQHVAQNGYAHVEAPNFRSSQANARKNAYSGVYYPSTSVAFSNGSPSTATAFPAASGSGQPLSNGSAQQSASRDNGFGISSGASLGAPMIWHPNPSVAMGSAVSDAGAAAQCHAYGMSGQGYHDDNVMPPIDWMGAQAIDNSIYYGGLRGAHAAYPAATEAAMMRVPYSSAPSGISGRGEMVSSVGAFAQPAEYSMAAMRNVMITRPAGAEAIAGPTSSANLPSAFGDSSSHNLPEVALHADPRRRQKRQRKQRLPRN